MIIVRIKEIMYVRFLAQSLENSRCLINVDFFSITPDITNPGALDMTSSSDHLILVKYIALR